jgi:DNA-binding transcriptional ArsR family regulator
MHPRLDPARRLAEGLRALGDGTRLRILALLSRRPHYGEELAESLGLTPATISHHVKLLRAAGLVDARREPPYVLLHIIEGALEALTDALLQPDLATALQLPPEENLSARLLRRHLNDEGRVAAIPTSRRARAALLRWVASHLKSDRIYSERELRKNLLELGDDPDRLRDALLEQGWLHHSGHVYRRVEEVDAL